MTVIGVDWTLATTDPATCCVRIGPTGTNLATHHDSYAGPASAGAAFDSFGTWGGMKRCNLWDTGRVTVYFGQRCYTDSDVATMGQAMVEIPKHVYYVDTSVAGHLRYYVGDYADGVAGTHITRDGTSDYVLSATDVHPSFSRNSVVRDYNYVGAYEAYYNGSTLESKSGVTPTGSVTLSSFRAAAHVRVGAANLWEIMDYKTLCDLQLLYLVEYGHTNCQVALGYGNAGGSALLDTGGTVAYGNSSYGVYNPYDAAMSYRGVENLWGNQFTYIDGLITNDLAVWVADYGYNDTTPPTTPYTATGVTLSATGNGYGQTPTVASATACPYSFIPPAYAAGGAGVTYCCDGLVTSTGAGAYKNMAQPGHWDSWNDHGIFSHQLHWPIGTSDAYVGARLAYIGVSTH